MKKVLITILLLICPILVNAATYYVRTDGGSSAQCTGLVDGPYISSTSNIQQGCAFNHPFWITTVKGIPQKLVGGDTVIIGPGQYMMGLGAPNTSVCSQYYPWDCNLNPIPSGTASNPTRILGKGWDTLIDTKPQLWGNERPWQIFDLRGSNNVQIQYLNITDHSACIEGGPDPATKCKRDSPAIYPYGPWASTGILASDSANVLIKNVNIHGLTTAIMAGRLSNWTIQDSSFVANSSAGWNGDIGAATSSNSGDIKFINTKIQFSGCGERLDGTPYNCCSQDQGCYGDGLGTAKTGGNWLFDNVDISNNTSDGADLLYHNGIGSITITHSRFAQNAGNQVKVAAPTTITNTKMLGECAWFHNNPVTWNTSTFNNCRAYGNTLALAFVPGMKVTIDSSEITGQGDTLLLSSGGSCNGTEVLNVNSTVLTPGTEFNSGEPTGIYYASGATGNGDGPCAVIAMTQGTTPAPTPTPMPTPTPPPTCPVCPVCPAPTVCAAPVLNSVSMKVTSNGKIYTLTK